VTGADTTSSRAPSSTVGALLTLGLAGAGAVFALGVAELAARDRYLLAIAATLVIPIAVALYRRPVAVVVLWLLFAPLVMVVEGSAPRQIFWLVHRMLPVAALGATVLGPVFGTTLRRLPRVGLLELCMGGYVLATLLSIAATSPDRLADAYLLYDRIVVPMVLFLVLRLHAPDEDTIARWFPVLAALVLSQAAFGVLSWVAPEVLPDPWLNRAGSRTTGSLRHPNVYGITLLFGSALAFHLGRAAPPRSLRRVASTALLLVASVMAILTLSRATWLAVLVVLAGLAWLHPRALLKASIGLVPIVLLVTSSGVVGGITGEALSARLYSETSEESALSRLPVVMASVRMFEARPVVGWGYNRFDDHDQQFQEGLIGLFVPTKDHASHNLYLTMLAEQGLVGAGLYLGPAGLLAWRTARSRRYLRLHVRDRQLVVTLWLVLGAQVVVTMFSNLRVPFGFGVWWICLALIAVVTDRARPPRVTVDGSTGQLAAPPSAPHGSRPR
jgi:O-antigen ligase